MTPPTRPRRLPTPRALLACAACAWTLCAAWAISPAAAQAEGSFLFLEPHAGASFALGAETYSAGPAFGATLGMGGRIPSTPLRAFALAQFHYSSVEILRAGEGGAPAPARRAFSEGSLGGRALVAVTPHWRAFIDLGLGLSWVEREVFYPGFGVTTRTDKSPRPSILSGIGFQWRPIDLFSVGARADFGVLLDTDGFNDTQDPNDEISGRLNLCATIAFHL